MTQPVEPGERSDAGTGGRTIRALSIAAAAAFVLAGTGALVPGGSGEMLDQAAIAAVIAVPLVRVAALGIEFARERDRAFAAAAVALLAVVGGGAVVAFLG